MTYIELDVSDDLYEKLQELAEEDGLSVEDFIIDTLEDEVSFEPAEDRFDADDDDNDICDNIEYDDQ